MEKKKIQDNLHLYLGCEVSTPFEPVTRTLFLTGIIGENCYIDTDEKNKHHSGGYIYRPDQLKLKLRPLSSMTEEEWESIKNNFSFDVVEAVVNVKYRDKPKHVLVLENRVYTNTLLFNDGIILLGLGFDLFDLIPSGLAIDKTIPSHP